MKPEDVQRMFNEHIASSIPRKEQLARDIMKNYADSAKRVAIKFEPVADVIRAVKEVAYRSESKLKFDIFDGSAAIRITGSELSVSCYELGNNTTEYTGVYKYNIYFDYGDGEYFSLHFDESELNKVTYLIIRMIADYSVYAIIPKDTFYYKLNRLYQTCGEDTSIRKQLKREISELMTDDDKAVFRPIR